MMTFLVKFGTIISNKKVLLMSILIYLCIFIVVTLLIYVANKLLNKMGIFKVKDLIEYYPKKGHLPKIKELGCPIEEDLKRRDFTVNAMAVRTTDEKLIDIYGGKNDLQNKVLRVLHSESFIDDPTRILRALKFSLRFRLHLDDDTQKLQDEYLKNINYDMSWHRLKKELIDTFNMNRQRAYDRFVNRGIYKLLGENQVVPNINGSIQELIGKYPCKHVWLVYLGLFNLSNLSLTKSEQNIIDWSKRLMYEMPDKRTPFESLLIHRLRIDQCSNL